MNLRWAKACASAAAVIATVLPPAQPAGAQTAPTLTTAGSGQTSSSHSSVSQSSGSPASGSYTSGTTTTSLIPTARAPYSYILIDVDSGAVLESKDSHTLREPASLSKLVTALITSDLGVANDSVIVSDLAASMPASKIGLPSGSSFLASDLMQAMLIGSANDAAVALAEHIGNNRANFAALMAEYGKTVGLRDRPLLQDPAGLDDNRSYNGGNKISAFDLAVITRLALNRADIALAVKKNSISIQSTGGTRLTTSTTNRLLGSYEGTTGLKTGYTSKAGYTFIGSAMRNGRHLAAVILNASSKSSAEQWATDLMTKGFTKSLPTIETLPQLTSASTTASALKTLGAQTSSSKSSSPSTTSSSNTTQSSASSSVLKSTEASPTSATTVLTSREGTRQTSVEPTSTSLQTPSLATTLSTANTTPPSTMRVTDDPEFIPAPIAIVVPTTPPTTSTSLTPTTAPSTLHPMVIAPLTNLETDPVDNNVTISSQSTSTSTAKLMVFLAGGATAVALGASGLAQWRCRRKSRPAVVNFVAGRATANAAQDEIVIVSPTPTHRAPSTPAILTQTIAAARPGAASVLIARESAKGALPTSSVPNFEPRPVGHQTKAGGRRFAPSEK